MKVKAQSILEFVVILFFATLVAVVSLQFISNRINANSDDIDVITSEEKNKSISPDEANCIENGLVWDKQNGVCEAK